MRITKVRVGGRDVTVQRNIEEGYLRWAPDDLKTNKEITGFLEDRKQTAFLVSVLNKTLVRKMPRRLENQANPRSVDKKKEDWEKRYLENLRLLFQQILGIEEEEPKNKNESRCVDMDLLKELEDKGKESDLREYFSHKFQGEVIYRPREDAQEIRFDLVEDFQKALRGAKKLDKIAGKLGNYTDWAKWYIARKQTLLARSVERNRLGSTGFDGVPSRRRLALGTLAGVFAKEESFKERLADLETEFDLKKVCQTWQACWGSEAVYAQEDVDRARREKRRTPNKNDIGLPRDNFEFKRKLKRILQDHQRLLFGEEVNREKHTLTLFSQETVKYLDLYFPLKRSGKKLSRADICYYLKTETVSARLTERITNAMTQFLLQEGKVAVRNLGNSLTSEGLQDLKIADTFALKFMDACAFGANNLRNCLDRSQTQDILGNKALGESLGKLDGDERVRTQVVNRLKAFFGGEFHKTVFGDDPHETVDLETLKDFLWAVRGSIQAIRNRIVHFDKNRHEILNITEYEKENEKKEKEKIEFHKSSLSRLLDTDIKNIPTLFAEKLRSDRIFDWYPVESVQAAFREFPLFNRPLAFIPAFARVFSLGATYQHNNTYPLGTNCYFKKDANSNPMPEAMYEARRNALRLVYTHHFIGHFLASPDSFGDAVEFVLGTNEEHAGKTDKKDAWAFREVVSFSDWKKDKEDQSSGLVAGYLKFVQSTLILEENRKRKEHEESPGRGLTPTQTGHFQKFLWEVFAKGFDTYLKKEKDRFGFIADPQDRGSINLSGEAQRTAARNRCVDGFQANIKHKIKPEDGGQVAFWTLCKMLDARTLNELGNQFSKMMQAETKGVVTTGLSDHLEILQEIIQLCLLTADHVPPDHTVYYGNREDCLKALAPYVKKEAVELPNSPYKQEEATPVMFSSVELAKKYATEHILAQVLENHRLDPPTIGLWKEKAEEAPGWAKERQTLHDEWVEARQKSNKAEREWLSKTGQNYLDLCRKLDDYNWLDNKVHLVHVRDLHHLLIAILARMMGFVALWERDFCFYNEQLNQQTGEICRFPKNKNQDYEKINIENFSEKRKSVLYEHFLNPAGTGSPRTESDWTGRNWKEKRNYVAHMEYLNGKGGKTSLLCLLYDVRSLMSYDRKLKNAVAKSFVDLLDRHGITVTFKPLHEHEHRFVIEKIEAKMIRHLGDSEIIHTGECKARPIKTLARSGDYVEMVRALLEFTPA